MAIINSMPIGVGSSGGADFNIAYGDTAPSDTSKLWVKTAKPNSVHISSNVEGTEKLEVINNASEIKTSGACSCRVGDNIYVIGGSDGKIYCFNVKTKESSSVATLSNFYDGVSCVAIGTDIYMVGGRVNRDFTSYVRKLNTLDNTLDETFLYVDVTRSRMSIASVGSYIYIFGGTWSKVGTTNYYSSIGKIDLITGTKSWLNSLPSARSSMGCCTVGKYVYLFGGYNDAGQPNQCNTIYKFDTITEITETLETVLPFGLTMPTCCSIGRDIYIFGGTSPSGNNDQILKFDTVTETIETLSTKLPIGSYGMCAESDGNNCFLFGGTGNSTVLDEIYEFTIDLPLEEGCMEILTGQSGKPCKLLNGDSAEFEVGVKGVFVGNAEGIAERAEAYIHNGTEWVVV